MKKLANFYFSLIKKPPKKLGGLLFITIKSIYSLITFTVLLALFDVTFTK